MALTKRKLGNSGLEIAPIVFGGNVFGWTADEATSFTYWMRSWRQDSTLWIRLTCIPNGCREIEAGVRDDHRQMAETPRTAWRQGRRLLNGRLTSVRTSPFETTLGGDTMPALLKKQPRQVSKSEFGM